MEPLYKGHIETLETVLYIEVVLNSEVIQWNLSIKDTLGPWKLSFILYIEVVLNSEVIQWNLSIKDTLRPWKLSFI